MTSSPISVHSPKSAVLVEGLHPGAQRDAPFEFPVDVGRIRAPADESCSTNCAAE
ncbi:MAG: hypothetical protein H6661_11075 [Ardenticatenaceae bacterium]|nr:hypothetical protein [Ardenticatenaceae bacterium]